MPSRKRKGPLVYASVFEVLRSDTEVWYWLERWAKELDPGANVGLFVGYMGA